MLMLPDFRVRQRDYLLEITRAITAQLDLDEVLRVVLTASLAMLAGEVGLIALREPDRRFRARATIGVEPDKFALFDPLLENLTDETDTGLNLTELDLKMRLVARKLDIRLRQVVALPMMIRREILGVIFVFRTYAGQASANDQVILQSFADQAAIAVVNARLYQTVSEERGRLAAILDHSADGVMILAPDQRITRFNRALGRFTGWTPAETIGRMHDTVIVWDRIDQGQSLGAALRTGWGRDRQLNPLYVEGDIVRPDGSQISLGITYAPLINEEGHLINIIANVRDITHWRRAQEAKNTFISVISHELKTPVALIKGYASTLRREDADWDRQTLNNGLKIIEEETDRLSELIDNLLAASKLQAEGMRLAHIEAVDLTQLVSRSVERFRTQTQKHTLILEFPPNFPEIRGDEARLRQVIDNLINNAIKYSPNGGKIRLSGSIEPASVGLSISDQGVGIPRDEQDHIFDPFYRVEDSLSRQTQGTGLGLYLSKAVIEAHGGSISVESQPNKGSTFRITLPR